MKSDQNRFDQKQIFSKQNLQNVSFFKIFTQAEEKNVFCHIFNH